jgi:tight adherence protein C
MLIAIFIMVFASCFMLLYTFFSVANRDKQSIETRLHRIKKLGITNDDEELSQPLLTRVIRPMLDSMGKAMMKITPREMLASLENKVIRAGNPGKLSVKEWANVQALLVTILPLITFIVCKNSGVKGGTIILFILSEIAMGFVLPSFILGKIITSRQTTILNSLPDVIDLITVSVEAGLGFDGALLKVVEKKPGPLASEFEKVLQEIKVGRQKKDSLRDMSQRLDIQDFTAFTGAIIQADQFGVGIAKVLRIQSDQMRLKRKQRAQEKAMKIPVKMLIPMVVFIFPTLFIVLLGPVVIKLIEQFSAM